MPLPRQTSWDDFLGKWRALGYEGPKQGGRHPFMQKGNHKPAIPKRQDFPIHTGFLKDILRKAGISEEDWLNA